MNFKKFASANWPIILITSVALILRLWRLESLTTFSGDLAYDIEKIRRILNGDLILLGSPIGRFGESALYLGPLYYYLEAPILWLTRLDPIGVSVSIVLVRLLTTAAIYFIAKRLFGMFVAVFAAVISSLSPYWVDSLGPPSPAYFVLLTTSVIIFLLLKTGDALQAKNPKLCLTIIFALGFLSGASTHFHYLGLVSFPALLFYLAYALTKAKFKSFITLLLGFLLMIAPHLIFEFRNKFFLTSQLVKQLTSGALVLGQASLAEKLNIALGHLSAYSSGITAPLLVILLAIWVVYFHVLRNSAKAKPIIIFMLSIIVINTIAAALYYGLSSPHYLAASYPPVFIFLALALVSTKKINKLLPVVTILVISIVLFQKNNFFSPSGYTMPQDLTLPTIRGIARIIAADAASETFNITSTLDGDSRAGPYRYLVSVYGKISESVENYNKPDSLYIITRDPARDVRLSTLFEIASFQPSNLAKVWEIKGDIRLIKLSKTEVREPLPQKFVTIINPVRSRDLWPDKSINRLKDQIQEITTRGLDATWLLTYDSLLDQEIIDSMRDRGKSQEIGAFLEVSQEWATDAHVSYKIGDGDYYRPDKVFLSGYDPVDRQKLLKKYFQVFFLKFGQYPKSVGAWYVDSYSQSLLSKMGVTSALTVADQFDTDAATIWGKYFSYPFYPSKYNSLAPAASQSDKIPVVNLQWAQRDPVAGYGKQLSSSRQSFQANDYLNNSFDHAYFKNLLSNYLANKDTDFLQITIGLEAGQEAVSFSDEYKRQLEIISALSKNGEVQALKMADFSKWYQEKYPGISPSHFLKKGDSFWYMSSKFRAAVFKEKDHYYLKDLRIYSQSPQKDHFYKDEDRHLSKEIPSIVDSLVKNNQLDFGPSKKVEIEEKFDRLKLNLDSGAIEVGQKGVTINGQYKVKTPDGQKLDSQLSSLSYLNFLKNRASPALNIFKYSKISGNHMYGFALSPTKLIGFKGLLPTVYDFDFQSLSKFKSPAQILEKWQPWIE